MNSSNFESDLNPYRKSALRREFPHWIGEMGMSHAITLNPNRPLTYRNLRKLYGTFCHEMDRQFLKRHAVYKCPSEERFLAIAFPEHLQSNAHLHLAARLTGWLPNFPNSADLSEIDKIWQAVTKHAGTTFISDLHNFRGWAWYITKEIGRPDHDYMLSMDFHPH